MTRSAGLFYIILRIAMGLALAGCGGGSMQQSTRQLQSVMVTPAAADAMNSPGGRVQFTATGSFNMAPMTVSPLTVVWSVGGSSSATPPMQPMQPMAAGQSAQTGPSIDANGVAQCNGFTGSVIIQASAPVNPGTPLSQMGMTTANVMGQAQLTCP